MTGPFAGKVALVTGVARVGQIGHAIARELAARGAAVALADVNAAAVEQRVAELRHAGARAAGAAGDLTRPEAVRAAVAAARRELGGLDVVINVAGGLLFVGPFVDLPPETYDKELAINLTTAVRVCQAAIPALLERGGGAIVNFASVAVLEPAPQLAGYTAAKAAVAGLTRALAREYADHGIRVNAVAPAAARTGDNLATMSDDAKRGLVPLETLVEVVLFLASDAARGVTGQVVGVTGRGG